MHVAPSNRLDLGQYNSTAVRRIIRDDPFENEGMLNLPASIPAALRRFVPYVVSHDMPVLCDCVP